ncbi:MAG TPA: prolyl oligopeptidase family serine peptidase [Myxococcota bacterium]|nr:prolyl oligopeptidase family serine peptidase [Myxococcota bacterium]
MLPLFFVLLLACAPLPDAKDTAAGDDTVDTDPGVDTPRDSDDDTPDVVPPDLCGNGALDEGEDCDGGAGGACGCTSACTFPGADVGCDDGDPCTVADACDGAGGCASAPMDCDDGDACTTDACSSGACLNEAIVCDDQDPCTTDTCEAGACRFDGWDGDPLSLWDLTTLRDPSTLNVRVVDTQTVIEGITPVQVQEIRYTSYESEACELRPIELEAYVAIPSAMVGNPHNRPGLVVAHGLGAWAEPGSASNPAAQLGAVVLAWSGPGQGQSEGTGSTPDHLFDVMSSPRDSWFWEHAVAGIRGLTLLQALPEVDPSRLAMSGYSGGAVATLLVNGVDDRLSAAVPTSGTGHLDLAANNPTTPGWELALLQAMTPPRDAASPEWQRFEASLDPAHYLTTAHAPTFLINGAQDEFFPIDATAATLADLQATGGDHRLHAIINWDHGWFALFAGDQPAVEADRIFEYWMRHHLGLGPAWREPVPQPVLVDVIPGVCDGWPCAMAVADLPGQGFDVTDAKVHFSVDGLAWFTADLDHNALGWTGGVPFTDPNQLNRSTAAWIVEFELQAGLLGPKLRVSAAPSLPPAFHPTILAIAGPLPL